MNNRDALNRGDQKGDMAFADPQAPLPQGAKSPEGATGPQIRDSRQ